VGFGGENTAIYLLIPVTYEKFMTPSDNQHLPVMLTEAISWMAPKTRGVYCDATVGLGGHARGILEASGPDGRLIGIDRDPEALAAAAESLKEFGDRVMLVHARFSEVRQVLEKAGALPLDGCIADLGVSSVQPDRAERGFSFRRKGPLDMRMDPTQGQTAAEFLRGVSAAELERILIDYGEERYARLIARAVTEACRRQPLLTTDALAALVAATVPHRERHKDPATRTFQAVRIAVNQELAELDRFLGEAPGCLRVGGRLCVIAFHSLEDRMVKQRFRSMAKGERPDEPRLQVLTKHVVVPTDEETSRNPRARSAHLRIVQRLAAA
jgi:16S rRNA (cytosine1402-N4)-methyltransferase